MLQPPALQVAVECLPHMGGQLFAGLGQVVGKSRVIPFDDLVKQRLFGPVALVTRTARFHTVCPTACIKQNGRIAHSGDAVSQSMACQ